MYSDFAYGHSQASLEEIALVRDLVAWAKKPTQLPDAALGGTANVSVIAVNQTTLDATQVKLTLLDPDRNVLSEQSVATA